MLLVGKHVLLIRPGLPPSVCCNKDGQNNAASASLCDHELTVGVVDFTRGAARRNTVCSLHR